MTDYLLDTLGSVLFWSLFLAGVVGRVTNKQVTTGKRSLTRKVGAGFLLVKALLKK